MENLAGNKDADIHIKEELFLAGIPMVNETSEGEVPFTIIGKKGDWTFRRAWYYWMVSCENKSSSLTLKEATDLHYTEHPTKTIMGNTIRCGGHCGCPEPEEYGAQPEYNEELNEKLVKLGYEKVYSNILGKEYVPITVGEVSELCNNGKLDVERYVDSYHIDD